MKKQIREIFWLGEDADVSVEFYGDFCELRQRERSVVLSPDAREELFELLREKLGK